MEAIARIQRYTKGMTFTDFAADEKTIDAVIKNIAVIGEAARHLPIDMQERHPQIAWEEMRGMRNVVMHEYFGVSIPNPLANRCAKSPTACFQTQGDHGA